MHAKETRRMDEAVRRFWMDCPEAVDREWLLAEAFELGALGAEEAEAEGRFRACIYAAPDSIEHVRSGLVELASDRAVIHPAETPPEVDWTEAWKEGLEALEVSDRLVVRPPFVEFSLAEGQGEIVIDPGQAFGTGAHASTHLCLEWMDRLISAASSSGSVPLDLAVDRVLDVGTGSGVLALAAIRLGAASAIGFDLDPVAIEAADEAARLNGLEHEVQFFTGPIEAVPASEAPFPLVVANLLKREMLPLAASIAQQTATGGRIVLAGLLEEDLEEVLDRFGQEGFCEAGRLERVDGVGRWAGLCLERESA